ncbi:hypothetical protein JX266_010635 [Neoarthrinium moseri]|nr:hypothetical protein JX266_010635 [Neoarthrinium moseri]
MNDVEVYLGHVTASAAAAKAADLGECPVGWPDQGLGPWLPGKWLTQEFAHQQADLIEACATSCVNHLPGRLAPWCPLAKAGAVLALAGLHMLAAGHVIPPRSENLLLTLFNMPSFQFSNPTKVTVKTRPPKNRSAWTNEHNAPTYQGFLLFVGGAADELEKLHGFRPGGYYPLHLQDELHNGQYRIIHKLGHGGLATVWLCEDRHAEIPTYVAIKIHVAREEADQNADLLLATTLKEKCLDTAAAVGRNFCLPQEHFVSQSPNGQHLCFVLPVLGPTVRHVREVFGSGESSSKTIQDISRQVVEALGMLHRNGICHGDFRPSNILLGLKSLDGLSVNEVFECLEEPETINIHVRNDNHLPPKIPHAPKYLVFPVEYRYVDFECIFPEAHIIDFGQAFYTSNPPSSYGIPVNYAAPEVFFDKRGTLAMDMWSLGCTLYEMRVGQRLFDVFQLVGIHKQNYVDEIASLLGEPPEPWVEFFEPDDEDDTDTSPAHPYTQEKRTHLIHDKLVSCHDCTKRDCDHPQFQHISEPEAAALADLLEKLLRYRAEERLTVQQVLGHPWFNTSY